MSDNNLWYRAKQVQIQTSSEITGNFDIGFDKQIPQETQKELRQFVTWVEENFHFPITLWVDFEYRHYLISRTGKRCGFLFYWSDFSTYPVFDNPDDIPIIHLPVRMERYTIDEILGSFIEAITLYFAWILNEISDGYEPHYDDVEDILQAYLATRQKKPTCCI